VNPRARPILAALVIAATPVFLWPALGNAVDSGTAEADNSITVTPARPGNIFARGDKVILPVRIARPEAADRLSWTLYDFSGIAVAHGLTRFTDSKAEVAPELPHGGYFEVQLEVTRGGKPISEGRTSFAMIESTSGRRPPMESHFGVMTHFAQGWDTDIMPLIARAGIASIRDEQYWDSIETRPGKYVFPDRFDRYMAEAAQLRLQPFIPLTFANDHYDNGFTPFSTEGINAYTRYAQAVLLHYGAQIHAVEIWNEFNGSFVKGPADKDRPFSYAQILKAAYDSIKKIRPDVTVVGGATVLIPLPYLESLFEHGALDSMDALSVHPYGYGEFPESVEYELSDLKALIARFNDGKQKPIWASEIGKQDKTPDGRKNTAGYLVRLSTILLSQGVQKIYWYLLRDYNDFVTMGLLRDSDSPFGRYAPAPAFVAYANLIRQLDAAEFQRREETDPRTRIYLFNTGKEQCRVAWVTDATRNIDDAGTLAFFKAAEPLRVTEIDGREYSVVPVSGEVSVRLTRTPIFVEGPVSSIRENRSDVVLTDSASAFSGRQGANGWYYGYFAPTKPRPGQDGFVTLAWLKDNWAHYWGAPSLRNLKIDREGAHPGLIDGRAAWAVRRWQSAVEGRIGISGHLERAADEGDGSEAQIIVDGRSIYIVDVGGPNKPKRVDFAVDTIVHKGSTVDIGISPGPAGSTDVNYDATGVHVTITMEPK
jgi:hypothetical protein